MTNENYEQLEKRVKQLEDEVQQLKQQQAKQREQPVPRMPRQEKQPDPPAGNSKSETGYKKPAPEPSVAASEKEPTDWEHLIGRVWLPRIFIFVLLMGLIWGFRVAVDYGVLTEPVRVALGFAAAAGAWILGEKQIKTGRQSLGKSLLTGAIGFLVLTTFAMNVLYGMIPTVAAFGLNIAWVAAGIFLADRHRSQVMAVLMAVTGYLVPFLVAGTGNVLGAVVYETVFYAALVSYAIYKKFKWLFYVATGLLHVVYLVFMVWLPVEYDEQLGIPMAAGAVLQHVIIFYAVYRSKFQKMFPVPLLFTSFIVTTFWARMGTYQDDYLYVMYLLALAVGYALVVYAAKNMKRQDLTSVALSVATFSIFLLLIRFFENEVNVLTASFLLQGIMALYLGFRFKARLQKFSGAFVYAAGAWTIMFTYVSDMISLETLVWLLFITTLYSLVHLTRLYEKGSKRLQTGATFAGVLGHLLFFLNLPYYDTLISLEALAAVAIAGSLFALFIWTKEIYAENKTVKLTIAGINVVFQLVVLTDLVRIMTSGFTDNITMMAISFSWALYAAVCVVAGIHYNKKVLRLLGLGLLIVTLAKLILFDLQHITIAVRAVLFIGLGVLGMLLSRLLYVKK